MKLRQMLIAIAMALVMVTASGFACATSGGPKASEAVKIQVGCDIANGALEGVTAAYRADVVPRSALEDALAIHKSTDRWCNPVVDHLTASDYAALLAAGASIAAKKERRP
jgi:hypothetical protein